MRVLNKRAVIRQLINLILLARVPLGDFYEINIQGQWQSEAPEYLRSVGHFLTCSYAEGKIFTLRP
jgi:hypothetical protein